MQGLRQGCILSPLLFSFFINELSTDVLQNGKYGIQLFPDCSEVLLLLFADDVILVSDVISGLQKQLNILEKYADTWGLTVNLDKTHIVVFRRGGRLAEKEKWYYKGVKIETVDSYRYLGILLHPLLK